MAESTPRDLLIRAVHDALRCNCDSGAGDEMIANELLASSAIDALVADRVTERVRAWVKDVAYDADDFVVDTDDVKALLDSLDPNWREVFK